MNDTIKYWIFVLLMFGFTSHAMAQEIAVIVYPDLDASALNREQIAQIFTGKSNILTPYDQSESSPARAHFYKAITGRTVDQVKAMWSKLVFSGRGRFPEELINSKAVKRTIASDPKGIGFIEKSEIDDTVKVVLILE